MPQLLKFSQYFVYALPTYNLFAVLLKFSQYFVYALPTYNLCADLNKILNDIMFPVLKKMTLKQNLSLPLKQLRSKILMVGWIFVFLFPPVVPCLLMAYEKRKVAAEKTETGIGCCSNYYFVCSMVDALTIVLTILGWVPGSIFAAILLSAI